MEKAEGFAIPVVQRRKQARERAAGLGSRWFPSPWSPSHCLDVDDVQLLGQTVRVLVTPPPSHPKACPTCHRHTGLAMAGIRFKMPLVRAV